MRRWQEELSLSSLVLLGLQGTQHGSRLLLRKEAYGDYVPWNTQLGRIYAEEVRH
jgi:hypothetical protein